jgi:hypothetical protein
MKIVKKIATTNIDQKLAIAIALVMLIQIIFVIYPQIFPIPNREWYELLAWIELITVPVTTGIAFMYILQISKSNVRTKQFFIYSYIMGLITGLVIFMSDFTTNIPILSSFQQHIEKIVNITGAYTGSVGVLMLKFLISNAFVYLIILPILLGFAGLMFCKISKFSKS